MPLDTNAAGIQVNSLVTPQFPVGLTGVATTANVTYTDAPTNTVELLPASGAAISAYAPRGMRLTSVRMLLRASAAAALEGQLYVVNAGGTVSRFIASKGISITTLASGTEQTEVDFGYSDSAPLILAAGERLFCAISVNNTGVVFRAEGGGY